MYNSTAVISHVTCNLFVLSYLDILRLQSKQNELKTSVIPSKLINKTKSLEITNDLIEFLLDGDNSGKTFSRVLLRMSPDASPLNSFCTRANVGLSSPGKNQTG